MKRVVIFADEPDWHTRRLTEALQAGGTEPSLHSLRQCCFRLGERGPGILNGGIARPLPDLVLVRSVAAGSFEQVTLRLSFLHALEALGIPVINSARAIERCVDKSMTSFLLERAGLPVPPTLVTENPEIARGFLEGSEGDLVLKPLFGSQGKNLARLAPSESLPQREADAGVYYLQRIVASRRGWHDFRVMVVGGEAVAGMIRHGKSWITNVAQGARCESLVLNSRMAEMSVAAVAAVGADYAGVDLIEDEAGSLYVLEVNSSPSWQGLQGVTAIDLAKRLADHARARAR